MNLIGFEGHWTPTDGPIGHGTAVLAEEEHLIHAATNVREPLDHLPEYLREGALTALTSPIDLATVNAENLSLVTTGLPLYVAVFLPTASCLLEAPFEGVLHAEQGERAVRVFSSQMSWTVWALKQIRDVVVPLLRSARDADTRRWLCRLGLILDAYDPTICAWRVACRHARVPRENSVETFRYESRWTRDQRVRFDTTLIEAEAHLAGKVEPS